MEAPGYKVNRDIPVAVLAGVLLSLVSLVMPMSCLLFESTLFRFIILYGKPLMVNIILVVPYSTFQDTISQIHQSVVPWILIPRAPVHELLPYGW